MSDAQTPPRDPRQQWLPEVGHPPDAAAAARAEAAIEAAQRDARLLSEHDLVRERRPVYVLDTAAAAKRKGGAERMARLRERQRAADQAEGVVRVAARLPRELAAQIEAAGGLTTWLAAKPPASVTAPAPAPEVRVERVEVPVEVVREVPVEVVREVVREVPAKLSRDQARWLAMGRQVDSLRGWRRSVVRAVLPPAPAPKK